MWLHRDIPDHSVTISGFQLVRADRDFTWSYKRKGGGLVIFLNKRWCNPGHIPIKENVCCPDIDLLVVRLQLYYLSKEIPHVIVVVVYNPPSTIPTLARCAINSVIAKPQTKHPNAHIIISDDFNHVTMEKTLTNFTQFVLPN